MIIIIIIIIIIIHHVHVFNHTACHGVPSGSVPIIRSLAAFIEWGPENDRMVDFDRFCVVK